VIDKKRIENFKDGTFVITVPKGTYRSPPAPYERACLVANYFQKNNIKGKVAVINPREKPTTKAKGFLNAFNTLYKNTVEYRPMSNIKNIDFGEKRIFILFLGFYFESYFRFLGLIPIMFALSGYCPLCTISYKLSKLN